MVARALHFSKPALQVMAHQPLRAEEAKVSSTA